MANEVNYIPCKYRGNGSTTQFSFEWKILNVEDIIVQYENASTGEQTTKTYGSDYTVTFNEMGGYVHCNSAPSSDYYIVISRDVSDYQSKTYSTSTGFQGSEIENSFDRVSCNIQEVEYDLQRSIKVKKGSQSLDLTLPEPDANKTLKWNEAEDGLENSTIDVDELESIAERLHESIDNIDIVADNILDVNDVADIQEDVSTVASIKDEVVTVAGISTNIVAVDENKTNINAVNANKTNIDTVANAIGNVNTVATDIENVVAVANNKTNIDKVGINILSVVNAGQNIINITRVGDNIQSVINVSNNATNINAVNANKTNIDTVATNIPDINTCVDNMSAIVDAPNQAQTATTQAGIATDKADECIVALAQAESLRGALEMFSCIDCGYFGETQSILHDAGTFDDPYDNYIDCGSFGDYYISQDDISNIIHLPALQNQVTYNGYVLNNTIARVSQNETDIAELQDLVAVQRDDIDSAVSRIGTNENNIIELQQGLQETNLDLGSVRNRVTTAEGEINELQEITDIFRYIDCGHFGETISTLHDAGTFDEPYDDYINCGSFNEIKYLSQDDITNVLNIGQLQKQINDTDFKLKKEVGRIDINVQSAFNLISQNKAELKNDISELQDAIDDINDDIDTLEGEIDETNDDLLTAVNRISANEDDIEELQNRTSMFTGIDCGYFGNTQTVIHDAGTFEEPYENYINCGDFKEYYISQDDLLNLSKISVLKEQVNNNEAVLNNAITEIEENRNAISELQKLTEVFNYIDCGYFGEPQAVVHDAGTFDEPYENYIDCGTPERFFVSIEDLKNIVNIPMIQNAIKALSVLIQSFEARLAVLEEGIDCGYFSIRT